MNISIDRKDSTPVYIQISKSIKDSILDGSVPAGSRLPPERKLAQSLGVNRTTILNAYNELRDEGLVESHVGQGTTVANIGSREEQTGPAPMPLMWEQLFNESSSRYSDTTVKDILRLANDAGVISFAAGVAVPDAESLEMLKRIQKDVLDRSGCAVVNHLPTQGLYSLRRNLAVLLEKRGIRVSAEETMVLSGSQQGLDLTARVFLDPGDIVFVEEPTFFCALQIFRIAGARVIGVPADKDGMRVDILGALLERYKPKLIYTIPDFQNPSGAVMSLERRRQLLSLAYRYRVAVLEDDPYGQLRYEGKHLPALKELDRYGYVLYLSTFSKLLFPGMRVGWLTAPVQVIDRLTSIKEAADLHSSSLSQYIFDRFLSEGLYDALLERVTAENRLRRDIMHEKLADGAVRGMDWQKPEGGLYIWCRLPDRVSQSRLVAKAAEQRVAFAPGNVFYPGRPAGNYIRLNFTFPPANVIGEGVRRLVKAVGQASTGDIFQQDMDFSNVSPIV